MSDHLPLPTTTKMSQVNEFLNSPLGFLLLETLRELKEERKIRAAVNIELMKLNVEKEKLSIAREELELKKLGMELRVNR